MSDFKYNLPEKNIAQYPSERRGETNLLVLERGNGNMEHKKYFDIPKYIKKGDIVVLNETKVLKQRTYFLNTKGKKVEVFFLNLEKEEEGFEIWFCLIGRAKNVHINEILVNDINKEYEVEVMERKGNGFLVKVKNSFEIFENCGHIPLPPYMKRDDKETDKERYNTVFSKVAGSSASPTASLNLTEDILKEIEERGVEVVKVELKVGWGTFAPIREKHIEDHKIHREYISVSKEVAGKINNIKKDGGDVWAFGTTVARTLESVTKESGEVFDYEGYTDLYIYPGYRWKCIDHLITNFHQPDSSLILLVSSFAGKELIKNAYKEALNKDYKFLSYGDSMLII